MLAKRHFYASHLKISPQIYVCVNLKLIVSYRSVKVLKDACHFLHTDILSAIIWIYSLWSFLSDFQYTYYQIYSPWTYDLNIMQCKKQIILTQFLSWAWVSYIPLKKKFLFWKGVSVLLKNSAISCTIWTMAASLYLTCDDKKQI